jgi:hypothetical protein
MFDEHRRPVGRLFYLLVFVVVGLGVSWGQAPNTTTISDVVYRAGWNPSWGNASDFLADIQHGCRAVGGGGEKERDPGIGRSLVGGPGSEHAGRNLLHRRVPA